MNIPCDNDLSLDLEFKGVFEFFTDYCETDTILNNEE